MALVSGFFDHEYLLPVAVGRGGSEDVEDRVGDADFGVAVPVARGGALPPRRRSRPDTASVVTLLLTRFGAAELLSALLSAGLSASLTGEDDWRKLADEDSDSRPA